MRKCTRCFIPMEKRETLYLVRHQIINHRNKVTNVPVFIYECPKCGMLELTFQEEKK